MRYSIQTVRLTVRRFRVGGIRNQILAFAVLATLVPSVVIAGIAYSSARRALTEKITKELRTAGDQAGRGAELWLKGHLYDLRVFANSYEVTQNLSRGSRTGRLGDYLNSLQARFSDYHELQVVDAQGRVVASNARNPRQVVLPADWAKALQSGSGLVGEPHWDAAVNQTVVTLGVPVDRDGRMAGALIARTGLKALADQLFNFAEQTAGRVNLVTRDGRLIVDSKTGPAGENPPELSAAARDRLIERNGVVAPYRGPDGTDMMGSATRVRGATWLAIASFPEAEAYLQVRRLRNMTLAVVSLLLLVIGFVAYRLGQVIAKPLQKLTDAAARVSAGDLTVGLPEASGGEVGFLTQVFNDMVTNLRTHQAELERLSTTDSLTGLVNRRHMITTLGEEAQRARRYDRGFAILMVDVDQFKKYNDTWGHPAGDDVLRRLAGILKESTRANDCAARYGGEEFLVMLSETPLQGAVQVAERIREKMRQQDFDGRHATLSIGVALFPDHGDSQDAVIARADAALYEAKRAGRDKVTIASEKRESTTDGGGRSEGEKAKRKK